MGRISPGPTRWPPGAERRLVPAISNLKPQTSNHRPCRTLRPTPGHNSPSPKAGVPESTSPQAQRCTPTTPWAGLLVPAGRRARFYVSTGPAGHSDHPLGTTPRPPRPVCPNLPSHGPSDALRPPPRQDSPSPMAGAPGCPFPQALQEPLTAPCARLSIPAGPAGNSHQPLGWTAHPPRPVCPVLRSHRPCRTLRPPPGHNSPSSKTGVPESTSPQAQRCTQTTPLPALPIPPGRCALLSILAGPAGNSDRPLGPVVHPRRPCRKLEPPPGQDSPYPQAIGPGSTSPQALQDTPTTPWAGLPLPQGRWARLSIPTGPAGNSDHPLGWTPHPLRPVCLVLRPHRPCRTLRPPPGQDSPSPQAGSPVVHPRRPSRKLPPLPGLDSPSPQAGVPGSTPPQALQDTLTTPWARPPIPPGRCARFYVPTGPARRSDHPLGRTPDPPRPVCPVLRPHRPCWTLRPPPGQDSPSPQAGGPGCPSLQPLRETPATRWAGVPVPPGWCARFYAPTGPAGRSDHPLGRTPRPPRLVGPVLRPHRPCRKLRPPGGRESPSPQAGVPGSTPPQALQDAPTTPWTGLPIPPGRSARLSIPAGPAGNSDHPLDWTPHLPRPVCPVLRPNRPCRTLRPPPGQDSPSPKAGVPKSTSPQAQRCTPTNRWAGLPIPPGRCARFYLPTGPAGHSDHPLGRTPHPPRPEGPVVHPRRPCRKLRPPPGLDSSSPQAGVPGSTSPQALQDTPTTPWAQLPVPQGRCARIYLATGPAMHSDHPLGRTPRPPRPVCPVLRPHRPCRTLRPPPGHNCPSPKAGVPTSTSPLAQRCTPTTPCAGLPIPPGRWARLSIPAGPGGNSDRPRSPVVHPRRPCRKLPPPPGLDSPSSQAGMPGSTSLQALQDAPTTPWTQLPVPQGRCARIHPPTGPAMHSDHPLGRTPRPPRPMCPVLRPHRPCRTLRPPPGHNSPSPKAAVPESTSPQAQRCTPTTPWAGLPIPPGRCARFYVPTGPAGRSDRPLGLVVHLRRPCRRLPPPPGLDFPSPQGGVPCSTFPQALQDAPTVP